MPAYNFKSQFAPKVKGGEKRQTLRPPRKRPTRQGDMLFLYIGMRTKQCRLLHKATCKSVTPVVIYEDRIAFGNDEAINLDFAAATRLAVQDGFHDTQEFYAFFEKQYGQFPIKLELITW